MARRRKGPHSPGPITRYRYGNGCSLVCACGKRVRSTGNDDTLWRAHAKHVKRALAKEAQAQAITCTGDPAEGA